MTQTDPNSGAPAGERRETLRLTLSLPFRWLGYAAQPTLARVAMDLGADEKLASRWEAARLAAELERALARLPDAATVAALKILGRQVEVLTDAALACPDPPPAVSLNLSAEGLGFVAGNPLAIASWLGFQLILPGDYAVLGSARINRSVETADGWQIGAHLEELAPGAERRLNRFLLQQSASAPG